jgi:hypothetical protein
MQQKQFTVLCEIVIPVEVTVVADDIPQAYQLAPHEVGLEPLQDTNLAEFDWNIEEAYVRAKTVRA